MKPLFTLVAISFLLLTGLFSVAQSVQLSFPIDRSVTQRNNSDRASITIAGQIAGGSSSVSSYQLYYRTSTLDASGNATSTTGWNSVGFQSNGSFYITPTYSKGWYQLDMGVYNSYSGSIVVAASVKFGVGDVFVMAGQSNAQGVDDSNWGLPSTGGLPEWIVGVDLSWGCRREYPSIPSFVTITGQKKISPTGHSSWCYAVLGKKISDANGGMPVAFFNSAYSGTSILNWYESSMGNSTINPYSSSSDQYCLASNLSSDPNYFKGQPYLTLKNALNYYLSLFGVRALLWYQGEADADPGAGQRTTDKQLYKDRLQYVIDKTRSDFGHSDLSWMIARTTFINGGNVTASIRDAQLEKSQEYDKAEGPDTDFQPNGQLTGLYRSDGTHFNESTNSGLTYLGTQEWADKIAVPSPGPGPSGFNRIIANPVPQVFVSKNGSNRTLSVNAVSGAQEYRWGTDINDASRSGANMTSITLYNSGSIRCYIKDGNGNWRISPLVQMGCPSCREGVDELANEDPWGLALTTYPNPFVKDLTIEFNVPQAGSDVRLELIDADGKILRTITNGVHDKGHWKYPVANLNLMPDKIYFCRLKVGDLFVTNKLLPVN